MFYVIILQILLIPPLFAEEIHIGILDWRSLENFDQHWLPSLKQIERKMPAHELVLHPMNLAELDHALEKGTLDFVITNPGHYVALSSHFDLAPIAQLQHIKEGLPLNQVGSVMLTRSERDDIQDFSDLKGLRVGAVGGDSFGGYQLMLDRLQQSFPDMNRWGVEWHFSGFPMDKLLERLLNNDVDAIILRSCLVEVMALEGKIELTHFRQVGDQVIATYPCKLSTDLYPGWPLLRTARVNDTLARQVVSVLMSSDSLMIEQDLVHWQPPVSYQSVYEVFERLRIGPFAAFPHNPVLHWLLIHKHWLMLAGSLLFLWVLHNLRTEYIVRQRTQELEWSQQRQKLAENESHKHQEELRHASRFALMGELTAGLAHELNQPLTAIANYARGSIRYLKREDQSLEEKRRSLIDAAEQIACQADQAAAVMKNIRAFLKKEAGDYSWVQIDVVIADTLLFCHTRLSQASIHPKVILDDHLPGIYSHRIYLLQILANLVTNALDAMEEMQSEECLLEVCTYYNDDEQALIVEVKDRGKGIDPHIESHLFEPFMTTRKEGMGLGLSLSRSLAESMGGNLTLKSRLQGGAVAQLRLPLLSKKREPKH